MLMVQRSGGGPLCHCSLYHLLTLLSEYLPMDKDLGGCWKVRTSESTGTLCGCSPGHGEHLNVAVTSGWAGSNQDSDSED